MSVEESFVREGRVEVEYRDDVRDRNVRRFLEVCAQVVLKAQREGKLDSAIRRLDDSSIQEGGEKP